VGDEAVYVCRVDPADDRDEIVPGGDPDHVRAGPEREEAGLGRAPDRIHHRLGEQLRERTLPDTHQRQGGAVDADV
jgi:hypothetical protein